MRLWILAALVCTACPASSTAPPDSTPPDSTASAPSQASPSDTGPLSQDAFKALHEHTDEAAPPAKGADIDLGGTKAYLSLPEGGTAPFPAIVVIHEWWGLNDNIKHWSDRLAADGYAALAVDLYGGGVAKEPDQAMKLMKAVDQAKAREILKAAHTFLAQDARVKAPKRGVIGWCFGGGWSLQHALGTADLNAAVIYYGQLVDDPSALGSIAAPVMGVFGNLDKGIPPASVDAFEAGMKKAGRPLEVHRFDAGHGFANPSSAKYDHAAAGQAWEHTRAFFAQHLKGG